MYIYIIPYIFILLVGILAISSNFSLNLIRLIFLFFLLPVFFIVIFRGNIGADTKSYESIITYYIVTNKCMVEPLFCLMSESIYNFVGRSDLTLRVITAIFCFLFYFAFFKTKNDIAVACLFVFPVFFYDMSTNGIRYGLAFVLFKLLFDGLNKKSILTAPIYLSIQTTSIVLVLLSFIKLINFKKAILSLVLIVFLYLLGVDYFSKKIEAYSAYSAPNFYSGILNFLLGLTIISSLKYFKKINFKIYLIYFMILLSFQIFSSFSYAGLRLVQLMLFYFSIMTIPLIAPLNKKTNASICLVLFLTGFIYFLNLLRIMSQSGDYIPYQFIF